MRQAQPALRASLELLAAPIRARRLLLALVALTSLAATVFSAIEPLVLAPAVAVALDPSVGPATSLAAATLNDFGPTLLHALGLEAADQRMAIVSLSVAAYVTVVALASLLRFAAVRLIRHLGVGVAADIQARLHRHLLALPLRAFERHRVGDLAARLAADVPATAELLELLIDWMLEASALVLIYGLLLARTDPRLFLSVAAALAAHALVSQLLARRIRAAAAASFGVQGELTATVAESLSNLRAVKSLSVEEFEHARFVEQLDSLRRRLRRRFLFLDAESSLRRATNAVVIGVAVLLAFVELRAGRLTLSGFVLFLFVARQAIQPLTIFGRAAIRLGVLRESTRRLTELLDASPGIVDGPLEASPLRDGIALRGVSFRYATGRWALRDVELVFPKGRTTALVGPSGAGKSTLADLVLRLDDPSAGSILYDGTDIRQFRQASYRQRFGVVSQEALIFNASAEDNIAYGRPIDRARIERAARLANAEAFIARLPQGYQTVVGERGSRLSGGERQRIAIARALYGSPEVLIFDEATSALDGESERLVQDAVSQALQEHTAIVIAHRLSTIRNADLIVVLNEGRIEATGRHLELLERSALYRRLHEQAVGEGEGAAQD